MIKYWKAIIPALFVIAVILIVAKNFDLNIFGSKTSIKKFTDTTDGSLQGYLNQAQNLAPRGGQASSTAVFLAAGDIMLSRNVAAAIQKSGDVDFPFQKMAVILKSTDFNFANLESPFYFNPINFEDKSSGIIGGHSMVFGAPITDMQGLIDFNFKSLNLANNHALDQGINGLTQTKDLLAGNNIQTEGTGKNLDEAWQPAIIDTNGIKIAFLGASYASANDSGKTENNYVARIEDQSNLKLSILNLKSKADFIVVTMHAGTEYTRIPNAAQTAFVRAAIDDGADMVIGSHPHWIQTVEKYRGKYIFYSLGNFIFDQNFSQDTKEGLTLKIQVSKNQEPNPIAQGAAKTDDLQGSRISTKLDSVELLPVIIENSQPRPATSEEAKKILKKIDQNTNILTP